jgi:hypothetical protein
MAASMAAKRRKPDAEASVTVESTEELPVEELKDKMADAMAGASDEEPAEEEPRRGELSIRPKGDDDDSPLLARLRKAKEGRGASKKPWED